MAGNVYLRTNRFEVKLEAITFKTRDFEYLCKMDFLFPHGKVWDRRPVVGLDVMRHPRDPSVRLVMLCFGVGCVILRFLAGEPLPPRILKFLSDKRIHFVGFGIPEKREMFPFGELGLNKNEVDIGYLAAKILKQPKCKTWELAELARKVLGIKRMIGLTEASSFERHEQIKSAICQLFITSVIAMGLLRAANDKKKSFFPHGGSHKKSSFFLKNLNSLHLMADGWFSQHHPKRKHKTELLDLVEEEEKDSINVEIGEMEEDVFAHDDNNDDDDDSSDDDEGDVLVEEEIIFGSSADENTQPSDPEDDLSTHAKGDSEDDSFVSHKVKESFQDGSTHAPCPNKKPLKGILKCPSTKNLAAPELGSNMGSGSALRRANSKGCNVTFKCDDE